MFYKYKGIDTVADSIKPGRMELTYVPVWFWTDEASYLRGDKPIHQQDFMMQLPVKGSRAIFDVDGNVKLIDGTFIPPDELKPEHKLEREEYDINIALWISENIERYLATTPSHRLQGDATSKGVRLSNDDPRGVLASPSVIALKEQIELEKPKEDVKPLEGEVAIDRP